MQSVLTLHVQLSCQYYLLGGAGAWLSGSTSWFRACSIVTLSSCIHVVVNCVYLCLRSGRSLLVAIGCALLRSCCTSWVIESCSRCFDSVNEIWCWCDDFCRTFGFCDIYCLADTRCFTTCEWCVMFSFIPALFICWCEVLVLRQSWSPCVSRARWDVDDGLRCDWLTVYRKSLIDAYCLQQLVVTVACNCIAT